MTDEIHIPSLVVTGVDPEGTELRERLRREPGSVTPLGVEGVRDGRVAFRVGLNGVPAGSVLYVQARDYPRIVGALQAQGHRVPIDAVLILHSSRDVFRRTGRRGEPWP